MQTTDHILMIRPVNFVFNSQTAVNNAFQIASVEDKVQQMALAEFDEFVMKLRSAKIDVIVVDDTPCYSGYPKAAIEVQLLYPI